MSSYIRTIQKRIMSARKIAPVAIINARGSIVGSRMPLLAHHVAYDFAGKVVKTKGAYVAQKDRQQARKGPPRGSRRGKRTVGQVRKSQIFAVPAYTKPKRSKTVAREIHAKKMEMKAAVRAALHARPIGRVHTSVSAAS